MRHILKLALGLALVGSAASAQQVENSAQVARAERDKLGSERLVAHQRLVAHDDQRLVDVHNRQLHDANRLVQVDRARQERETRDTARLAQENQARQARTAHNSAEQPH